MNIYYVWHPKAGQDWVEANTSKEARMKAAHTLKEFHNMSYRTAFQGLRSWIALQRGLTPERAMDFHLSTSKGGYDE